MCAEIWCFWPLTASTTSEVKNDHAHVITQDICNKFIEIKFSVIYTVWPPTSPFQPKRPCLLLIRFSFDEEKEAFCWNSFNWSFISLDHAWIRFSAVSLWHVSLQDGLPHWPQAQKVQIFWGGHKMLKKSPNFFDVTKYGQNNWEIFSKFCGLVRIYISQESNYNVAIICFMSIDLDN